MSSDALLAPALEVLAQDIDGDLLLFDGQHLHLLAGTAAEVWRSADGSRSADEIVGLVTAAVPAASDGVRNDVVQFLDGLVERGLLAVDDEKPSPMLTVPAHVAYAWDGDTVLVLDLRDGRRQALSPTGSLVWELICEHRHLQPVLTAVRAAFPDAPDSLEDEVGALVDDLVDEGLLLSGGG